MFSLISLKLKMYVKFYNINNREPYQHIIMDPNPAKWYGSETLFSVYKGYIKLNELFTLVPGPRIPARGVKPGFFSCLLSSSSSSREIFQF